MLVRRIPGRPRRVLAVSAAVIAVAAAGSLLVVHRPDGDVDDCGPVPYVTHGPDPIAIVTPIPGDTLPGYPSDEMAGALLDQVEAATRDRGQWWAGDFENGFTVYVGFTHDVGGARAEIRAKVPDAAHVVVYSAPYTWAQIHYGTEKVTDFAGKAGIPLNTVEEDTLHDRITVGISELRPQWIRELHAQFGCVVNVVQEGPVNGD